MKNKIYLGLGEHGLREIFKSAVTPTEINFGDKYLACIGPFRTMRGAYFMRDYGANNPHCRNVSEAEKLAKKEYNPFD